VVSDDAIALSKQLILKKTCSTYSGSISLDVLDESNRKGVFTHCKPLQKTNLLIFLLFYLPEEKQKKRYRF
jgi:hypothetical protein